MEVVLGQMGSNVVRSKIEQIDDYVIKRYLQNEIESKHGVIMKAYQGVMMKEHHATVAVAKGQKTTIFIIYRQRKIFESNIFNSAVEFLFLF